MASDTIHLRAGKLERPFFVPELSRKALEPVSARSGNEVLYSTIMPLLVRRVDGTIEAPRGVPYGALARIARLLNASVVLGGRSVGKVYLVLPVRLEFLTANVQFQTIARQASWLEAVANNVNVLLEGRSDLPSIQVVYDAELITRYRGETYDGGKLELNDALLREFGPHKGMVRVLSAHQVGSAFVAEDGSRGGTRKGLGFVIAPTSANLLGKTPSHDALWDPNEGKRARIKLESGVDFSELIPEVYVPNQVDAYRAIRSMVSLVMMAGWVEPEQLLNQALLERESSLRFSVGELRCPSELSDQQIAHGQACRDLVLDGLARLAVLAPSNWEIDKGVEQITRAVEAHA